MAGTKFTFAVVSDTHIRPRVLDDSSPWQANAKANARARYVVARLKQLKPDFIVHLGDMVHPVPKLPTYRDAADVASEIFGDVGCPLHIIPGNHDIGDKPMDGLPAEPVTDEALATYEDVFGKSYQTFTHEGWRFVLLNAELLNTGLAAEAAQEAWLAKVLADNTLPIIVCIHYPLFLYRPDERSSYDNLDEPARSRILDLLQSANVKTVFSGHVHHFFQHHLDGIEFFTMPAICFTRQDYSELFRVTGDDEWGRDDAAKLGFALVDVDETGPTVRIERTYGRELEEGETLEPAPFVRVHPRDAGGASLGLHLRHDWTEVSFLPHNPMEEFVRREVRNDYPVLALTELGAKALRIPVDDLMHAESLGRVRLLAGMGVAFTVFIFREPSEAMLAALKTAGSAVARVEIIADWRNRAPLAGHIARLREASAAPVFVSRVHSGRDERVVGSKYHHFVSSGFGSDDFDRIDAWCGEIGGNVADGFAFRVRNGEDPCAAALAIAAGIEERETRATAFCQLCDENPAMGRMDDLENANRVAHAFLAAAGVETVDLFLDTFADHDRAYFPRSGLYDRLYNPRLAGHVYRHLNAALRALAGPVTLDGPARSAALGVVQNFRVGDRFGALMMPSADAPVGALAAIVSDGVEAHDLGTGRPAVSGEKPTAPILILQSETPA